MKITVEYICTDVEHGGNECKTEMDLDCVMTCPKCKPRAILKPNAPPEKEGL